MVISNQESKAINSLRYLRILFLILAHTRISHLVDPTLESLDRTEKFLSFPFLSILFAISGYLFFYSKNNLLDFRASEFLIFYKSKISKRFNSLLVPYIIWTIISFAYKTIIKKENIELDILTIFWDSGDGHPIGMALWYMRNLIVFAFLSPLYYYTIKYLKHASLIVFGIIYYCFDLSIPADYIWFSPYLLLGSYLSLYNVSFEKISEFFNWKVMIFLLIFIKFYALWTGQDTTLPIFVYQLVCISAFFGIFLLFPISNKLSTTSTFVYFSHVYFTGIRNITINYCDTNNSIQVIFTWFLNAFIVWCICSIICEVLNRFCPNVYSVLIGKRNTR